MIACRPPHPTLQRLLIALVCLALLLASWPAAPAAATADWQQRATDQAVIFHPPELNNTAEQIAGLVEPIVQQMADLHGHQLQRPIAIRLYPTTDAYARSSPLAATPYGEGAQANLETRELGLSEPRLRNLTPEQTRNLLRRGVTQLILHEMTNGRIPIGILQGAAQYSERPNPEVEVNARLLDRARRDRQMLAWTDLNQPDQFAARAGVASAQSYAIIAFLLDRYGLAPWQRFLNGLRATSDYNAALNQAYGKPVETLLEEWEGYLPEYFGGSYAINYFARYDLVEIEEHLQAGRYYEARDGIEQMARFVANAGRVAKEGDIRNLAQRVNLGLEGDAILTQGRMAMSTFQYAAAHETFLQARQRYMATGAADKIAEADEAITTAEAGLAAVDQLAQAEVSLAEYRYTEARAAATGALSTFAQLGDAEHYQRSWLVIQSLNTTFSRLAYILAAVALANAIWAFWRLRVRALRPSVPGVLQ